MFAALTTIIPLIPGWIDAGVATYGVYLKIKELIDQDRSLTADERAQLEANIAEAQAVVRDTARDV